MSCGDHTASVITAANHVTPSPVIRAVPPGLALVQDIPVRRLACLALAFTGPVLTWHGVS